MEIKERKILHACKHFDFDIRPPCRQGRRQAHQRQLLDQMGVQPPRQQGRSRVARHLLLDQIERWDTCNIELDIRCVADTSKESRNVRPPRQQGRRQAHQRQLLDQMEVRPPRQQGRNTGMCPCAPGRGGCRRESSDRRVTAFISIAGLAGICRAFHVYHR